MNTTAGDGPSQPGRLFVIGTPIGNLEDISARALRLLDEVAVIAAEDTRHTRKLLSHFDLHTPLVAYHQHSRPGRARRLIERMLAGEDVALVTDAGTPTISDPGSPLLNGALEAGIQVVPIPGPCALVAALSASGLPASEFTFAGFLPRAKGAREKTLTAMAQERGTLIFYESPRRLLATLRSMLDTLGDRPAVVAREVTKIHEEFRRGPMTDLIAHYEGAPPRGECVILVTPGSGAGTEPDVAEAGRTAAALVREGRSTSDAARQLQQSLGLPKREAYAIVLRAREETRD